jgi:hypothetical protein
VDVGLIIGWIGLVFCVLLVFYYFVSETCRAGCLSR